MDSGLKRGQKVALSKQVEESLSEASGSLRNALAFAARNEKPFVVKNIADMVLQIDSLIKTDELLDKLEDRKKGDSGLWGSFFTD